MDAMLCLYNLEIPMRDGVLLRADLYRPQKEGAYPALLIRTVFRKDWMGRCFAQYDPAFFVRRGYVVVIQDVRGLGRSQGEFHRFQADGQDGFDTIEWISQQPFCDGNVGMMGNYYAGYLQLMAAAENPPHLKAICPAQTSVSINRDCDNRGFTFASHIGWCLSRQLNRLRDGRYDEVATREWIPRLEEWLRDYPHSQLETVPLLEMPAVAESPFQLLAEYKKHLLSGYDDLALLHREGRDMDVAALRVPAFYYCGWYDSARTPLIHHCMAQRAAGVDSRVLVAPWRMGESPAAPDGALESGCHPINIQQETLCWFDHWLKGKESPSFAPYRAAFMPGGEMSETETWPPCGAALSLWLGTGNMMLAGEAAVQVDYDLYTHDPKHPLLYHPYGAVNDPRGKPEDTRLVQYRSLPMEKELRIQGMVRCRLFLSSSARDADVMVSLSELDPDGKRFILCDGATRLSYRDGWRQRAIEPDQIYAVDVWLGELCCVVRPNHRLMLEICGSAFPKYDVNPGTGERVVEARKRIPSIQCVWHGGCYASALTLPVVSESE